MHEDTVRDLIDNGSTMLGSLLKEMLVHRNEIEILEAEKEKEVEVAQARERATESADGEAGGTGTNREPQVRPQEGVSTGGQMTATPAEIEQAIDELMAEEMCQICRELLAALKERPTRQQIRGVMEYGTFKHNLSDGADVEELKQVIRETDVLHDIFQQKYTGQGAQS